MADVIRKGFFIRGKNNVRPEKLQMPQKAKVSEKNTYYFLCTLWIDLLILIAQKNLAKPTKQWDNYYCEDFKIQLSY